MAELVVIVSLSVGLYLTYLNDVYFQSYANSISPILIPALSVAFGISSASIAAYLYVGIKRLQIQRDMDSHIKRKENHPSKESSESHREETATKGDRQPLQTRGRLRPVAASTQQVRPRLHPKESESHDSVPDVKKQA